MRQFYKHPPISFDINVILTQMSKYNLFENFIRLSSLFVLYYVTLGLHIEH